MKPERYRTDAQNRLIHKFFEMMAEQLNDAGISVQKALSYTIELDFTPELVKNLIWREVQTALYGKRSTTKLTTKEIDRIFDILNRHFIEKHGLELEFPSSDH